MARLETRVDKLERDGGDDGEAAQFYPRHNVTLFTVSRLPRQHWQ
jgi:hypothetical protein